jgi:hypothetical protein
VTAKLFPACLQIELNLTICEIERIAAQSIHRQLSPSPILHEADITDAAGMLPPTAGCGPDERIIRIPRKTLVLAKWDIPNHV